MHHRNRSHFSYRRRPGWKRYGGGVGLTFVLAAAILMATGWGSAVADQVAQISKVFVTNDSAHPVPVQEQRTDTNGNIKVHEQGTANANVTNDSAHPVPVHEQGTADVNVTNSLSVGSAEPITAGGNSVDILSFGNTVNVTPAAVATELQLHMTSDVAGVFFLNGTDRSATFLGPSSGAQADLIVPLSRPVKFDGIQCIGSGTGRCDIAWVGASP